jgi:dethiobiotin synthetase
MTAFVVTGTDTDVGKTVFSAALAAAVGAFYWKPVQAGLDEDTDSDIVARLSGLGPDAVLPEAYRLHTPCSPHEAARIDGVTIERSALALPTCDGPLVVEGAGGALVPLAGRLLYADIFADWGLPVIVAARTELGTINHSLLTIEALRRRGVAVHGVVFIGAGNPASEAAITEIGTVAHLGRIDRLPALTPEALAAAFAAGIRTDLL